MFERVKVTVLKFLDGFKATIRSTITTYQERLETGKKMAELSSVINLAINTVFPNIKKSAELSLNRLCEDSLIHLKPEVRKNCLALPLESGLSKVEEMVKETETFKEETLKAISQLQEREEGMVKSIAKIQKKVIQAERPSWLRRLFVGSGRRLNLAREKGHELIELYGRLNVLRLNIHLYTLLNSAALQMNQWLNTDLIPEIKGLIGKLDQCLSIFKAEHQRTDLALRPMRGFQIDLNTRDKITELAANRITAQIIESIALELKPKIEKMTPETIIKSLSESKLFDDVLSISAVDRLKELYPTSELGCQIQEWIEKQGSPYNPLNEKLLDNDPLHTTVIGISDAQAKNEIEKALSEREIKGSYSVSQSTDPEKVIILTTLHRIPAFALSGIDEWMRATQMKEHSGLFAVYPERRWREYLPITPVLSEVKIDNIILLGLCDGYIKSYGPGFFQLDGRKIHGIANLRDAISTDEKIQHEILEKWLVLYRTHGLSGIQNRLQSAQGFVEKEPRLSKMRQALLNKLVGMRQGELSEERFKQTIVGI